MKDLALLFAVALSLTGCKSSGSPGGTEGTSSEEETNWIQKPAPEFKLKDSEGKEVSLASFRGKPVLLNFWGIGCPNCEREVPSLVRLHDRYRDAGLVILGVHVYDKTPEQIKEFGAKKGIHYPLLVEGIKVANRYGVEVIPANFFIDPDGKVTCLEVGFDGEEKLEWPVRKMLPAKAD